MATQILLTLLKTSVVVLSIIQLVTCTDDEVANEADKVKTADADNNVEPTKQALPPLPTDPRQLGKIFSLLGQLQEKRPAVWEMVKNTFSLSQLKLPQMVVNFWNKYGWGKKETPTPTSPDQAGSPAPQKDSESADQEIQEGSKPSDPAQSSNILVPAGKETPVQAQVSSGTEQVAPASDEQATKVQVPQPPVADSSNTQEAHPVQVEVPQPPAAVPSNTQEAHSAQAEVPETPAAVPSNTQEAKPVQTEVPQTPAAVPSNTQEAHLVQAEVPQPPAADSSSTQEAHPVQAEVPQPPAAVPSNTQEAHPVQAEVPQPPAAVSSNTQEAHPVQAELPQSPAAVSSNTQEAHPIPQSAESTPSQVTGSVSPLLTALRKPNILNSAVADGNHPSPWARPPPAQAQPTDWHSTYERTGNYLDYLNALLNEPEEEVIATIRHFN